MSEEIHMMAEREAGAPESVPALGVGFFMKPSQNAKKSKLAGHPVFEDIDWIKIVVPGDRNSSIERPAKEQDKLRFPRSYAAYRSRETKPVVDGMPIEEWPQVTRSMALTLKAAHIFTVELLAGVSDAHINKFGPNGMELRAKAQAFLAVSKDAAAAQQFKAESERKDLQIADLQRQISEIAAKLQEQAQQPEKRGPGRPRKTEEAA